MAQLINEVRRLQELAGLLKEAVDVDKSPIQDIIKHLDQGDKIITKDPKKIGQLHIQLQKKSDGTQEGVMDVDKAKEYFNNFLKGKQDPKDIKALVKELNKFKNAKFSSTYQSGTYTLQKI